VKGIGDRNRLFVVLEHQQMLYASTTHRRVQGSHHDRVPDPTCKLCGKR
jgi:hypothetical protein